MLNREWALVALVYLLFAELLSLHPASDLSLCLIQPEHGEQATNDGDSKHWPAIAAANDLGVTMPRSLLARADGVVEIIPPLLRSMSSEMAYLRSCASSREGPPIAPERDQICST